MVANVHRSRSMVEASASLAQRVEAAEEPHVATKADIARLEKLIVETKSALHDRIGGVELSIERRFRLFLMWLIGTAIALAAVVIAAAAFIVGQLS